MHIATLNQLKKELDSLAHEQLLSVCLRLARYKKDNKELLHYLLMEFQDEPAYIELIKSDITEGLETVNESNLYYVKKGIRRVLKIAHKHIKYSGIKNTEIEVLLFFCDHVIAMDMPIQQSKVLVNMINSQLKKIDKAIVTLHEDLQYDYNLLTENTRGWVDRYYDNL